MGPHARSTLWWRGCELLVEIRTASAPALSPSVFIAPFRPLWALVEFWSDETMADFTNGWALR